MTDGTQPETAPAAGSGTQAEPAPPAQPVVGNWTMPLEAAAAAAAPVALQSGLPATGFGQFATNLATFEAEFKQAYATLSPTAKGLFEQAIAVAHSEGAAIMGAFKGAVAEVKAQSGATTKK